MQLRFATARSAVRAAGVLVALAAASVAAALVYCNVTDIKANPLPNAVQIVIVSDGVLNWEPEGGNWDEFFSGEKKSRIAVRLENARSKVGKNFISVNQTPVSHVELSIPEDAKEGVGLTVAVVFTQPSTYDVNLSEDQRTFTITVNTERTIERGETKTAAAGGGTAESRLEVTASNGLVSLDAVKADIHKLLGEIAAQTGVNVAVDDAVRHEVSMTIADMPVDAVLRAIASAYGLALEKTQQGVYMFSEGVPTDLATYNRSGTQSFAMRYLQAQVASGLLPTFLFSYLHVNTEQNAVVVTAPRQMLTKIGQDLSKTDIAPPQIMIEAIAVELTRTDEEDIGLSWAYRGRTDLISGDSTTGDLSYQELGPEDAEPGVIPTRELNVRLAALVSRGKAQIKANPRMAAMNGQTAEIFIGAQRFILVSFVQFGQQQERIQAVPVGVRLKVTPWTGGNDEITTKIESEVSNIKSIDPETGLPLLTTRRAESSVRVHDDETVVIGGLTQRQSQVTRRKVPFFGDLPIVGALFRSRSKSLVNSELVIFVTPRILRNGHLPEDEETALRERFLQPADEK
ncbi:MAG: type II secretion system protein GspD [Armatimonadota bacterium]